jgi:hypothetical protein
MTAAKALRMREEREPRPAEAADDAVVQAGHHPVAGDADARQQQVERAGEM